MTPDSARRLLQGPAPAVASRLLGATVWSGVDDSIVAVRVTEVEAYAGVGEDPGSHAHRGPTSRTASMFGPAGHAYVYFTYGMHWCLNVVCARQGTAAAVLIRAGEVIEGLDRARARRPTAVRDRDLARGPARLTTALGVTGEHDGADLLSKRSPVRLELSDPVAADAVAIGPRTGVSGAGALTPWRFALDGDPTVSPYRRAAARNAE